MNGDLEGAAKRRDFKSNGRGVRGYILAAAVTSGNYLVFWHGVHQCHHFAGQCGGSVTKEEIISVSISC